jgi:hypothetical protein
MAAHGTRGRADGRQPERLKRSDLAHLLAGTVDVDVILDLDASRGVDVAVNVAPIVDLDIDPASRCKVDDGVHAYVAIEDHVEGATSSSLDPAQVSGSIRPLSLGCDARRL